MIWETEVPTAYILKINPHPGTNATAGSPDTVGTLMVPAQDLDQYVSTLTSKVLIGLLDETAYTLVWMHFSRRSHIYFSGSHKTNPDIEVPSY